MVCRYLVELVRVWCSDHQTQPSQPAIALTKNTNKNSLHDGLSSSVEIVGTAREEHPAVRGVKMWWRHIFSRGKLYVPLLKSYIRFIYGAIC